MSFPDGPELDAREEVPTNRLSRLFGTFWVSDSTPNTSITPSATQLAGNAFRLARLRAILTGFDEDTPLKVPRVIGLSLTVIFGIVSWGIGINALVKVRQLQAALKADLRADSNSIDINIDDVFQTGVLITLLTIFITILAILFKLVLLFPNINWPEYQNHIKISPRSLTLQWTTLSFLSVWLFTVLVPYTKFVRTQSVQIRLLLTGNTNALLTGVTIRALQTRRGDLRYTSHLFLRLLSILPWFALLFAIVSIVLIYMANVRTHHFFPAEKVTFEEPRRAEETV